MIERFQGEANRGRLLEAVMLQEIVQHKPDLAQAVIEYSKLETFAPGEPFIQEGDSSDDIFFIIAGEARVVIKGHRRDTRGPGTMVGEMAAISPQPRSATLDPITQVVALRMTAGNLLDLGEKFPSIWKPIARMLSKRLYNRNADLLPPNTQPNVFVASSTEALPIAFEIQNQLQRDALVTPWPQGVFIGGEFALESLELAVDRSDFAIAVAHGDDIVETRGNRLVTLRDNVVFELGLFMGRLGRHRTLVVLPTKETIKLPSDLSGLTCISYVPAANKAELPARIGPACNQIRDLIQQYRTRSRSAIQS